MQDGFDPRLPSFAPPQQNRRAVTGEGEPASDGARPDFPGMDWIGAAQQGGGSVPRDFAWRSSPRERQEKLSMG